VGREPVRAADVRHLVEDLLARYTAAVDGRDLGAVTQLLGGATVRFDSAAALQGEDVAAAYAAAFAAGRATRHLLSTGVVGYEPETGTATATVPYQRWSLDGPAPVLTALGRFEGTFAVHGGFCVWRRHHVRRDWQAGR
jgi:hypothetical protein